MRQDPRKKEGKSPKKIFLYIMRKRGMNLPRQNVTSMDQSYRVKS